MSLDMRIPHDLPIESVVLDPEGDAAQHRREGWQYANGGPYSWPADELAQLGPLTVIYVPPTP